MKKQIVFFGLVIFFFVSILAGINALYEKTTDEQGNLIIKEGDNLYQIPQGFDVEIDENNNLIFANVDGTIEDFKFKEISMQIKKDAKVEYSIINEETHINLIGEGNLIAGKTELKNIKDAAIILDKTNQINYAEFISTQKEEYLFEYNNKEFIFNTEKGSRVFFNPAKNIIQGENTKLTFDNKDINGQNFNLAFDENGINQLKIINGFYYDKLNDLIYSGEDFAIYFDGRDISKEKNAISIFSERGKVQAIGKIKIESKDVAYEGLVDSAFFQRSLQGRDELVSINANEDKSLEQEGIAKLTKKFKTGNLLAEEGFAEKEEGIETIISRENGEIKLNLDEKSINLLTQIQKDPTKFALIDKNLMLELGDKQGYFGVNANFGMIYENAKGNNVEILSSQKTQQYLGNDINTIKGIITSQVEKNFGESLDLHVLELQKIYNLEKKQILGGENQLKDSIQNFEETKTFIEKTYTDSLQKDALLTSFMLNNFEGIKPDYETKNWNEQLKNQREFSQKALAEINKKIQSNEITQDFLIDNKGDLNSLSLNLLKKASENPDLAVQYKESFEKILENKIIYEDLAGKYISNYKKDEGSLINSYKGLLSLEETKLLMQQGELKLERDHSTFSTKKFNLAEALSFEYGKQGKSLEAFGLLDKLDNDFSSYIAETSQKIDFSDPAYEDQLNALKNLKSRIDSDRSALTNTEFNKIQLDLYTQAGEIQKVFALRKGYTEKVSEAEAGLEKLTAVVLSGGFGKDIVNVAGGFDDVKEAASILEQENQIYSKGVYGIQSLSQMNVPGQLIEDWINDKPVITNNFIDELLIKSGRATEPISESKEFAGKEVDKQGKLTGRKIITSIEGKRYAIDSTQEKQVFDFLEEVKKDAKQTYSSSLYGQDVQQLIGTRDIEYDETNYEALEKRKLGEFQTEVFKNRISELQFSEPEKVLNYIDEAISSAAIAITAATGAAGATFSSATGLTGVAYSFGENVLIDAATGAILISSGLSPEEHPYLATGISIGTSVTGVGLSKVLRSTSETALEDISKAIVKNSNLKEIEISNALKSLSSDQLRDINLVTKQLKEADLSIESSSLQKAFSDFELKNSARAKFEDAKLKIEKANGQNFAKQTESYCNDCVERSFESNYKKVDFDEPVLLEPSVKELEIPNNLERIYNVDPEHFPKVNFKTASNDFEILGYEVEQIRGITLEEYLKTNKLSPEMIDEMSASLERLHAKGIVHGNINSKNIIITEEGKNFKIINPSTFYLDVVEKEIDEIASIKARDLQKKVLLIEFINKDLESLSNAVNQKIEIQYPGFSRYSKVYFYNPSKKQLSTGTLTNIERTFSPEKKEPKYWFRLVEDNSFDAHLIDEYNFKYFNDEKYQSTLKLNTKNLIKEEGISGEHYYRYDKLPESWAYRAGPEIIVLDKNSDTVLYNFLEEVKTSVKGVTNEEDKMNVVFTDVMGTIQEYNLEDWKYASNTPVPIGKCIAEGAAICRHKAALLKKAYDEIGIESALVSGPTFSEAEKIMGYHAWNEVKLEDGKTFLVDPTWQEIYEITGKNAEEIKELTKRLEQPRISEDYGIFLFQSP